MRRQKAYHRICLKDYGDYIWHIRDSYGSGSYGIRSYRIQLNGRIIGSGSGNFGSSDEHTHTFDIYETASPSIAPSLTPSTSEMPSHLPTLSSSPSLSDAPTISTIPSITPSTSLMPSYAPSSTPLSTPSGIPS